MVLSDSDDDGAGAIKTQTVADIFGSDSDSGDDTDDMIKKVAPTTTNRLQKKRARVESSDSESDDEATKAIKRKRKMEKAARKKQVQLPPLTKPLKKLMREP